MIAVDTNILVYAHRSGFPQHRQALDVLERLVEGEEPFCLPVFVLAEFVRVVTHPSFLTRPSSLEIALSSIDALVATTAVVLHPGDLFWGLFRQATIEGRATGNLVFDAQIVALCREHGVRTILTEDRDFRRFDDLDVRPLAAMG